MSPRALTIRDTRFEAVVLPEDVELFKPAFLPWAHNLVLSWPASGSTAEQLISRTHRAGQQSDEVYVDYVAHTRYLKHALFQSQRDARYIESSLGTPQRLCYGSWVNGPVDDEELPQAPVND